MDQIHKNTNSLICKPNYEQERLARIHANPYDLPNTHKLQRSNTPSRRLLSYVKEKVSGAVSTLKNLLTESKEPSFNDISLTESIQLQNVPREKFNNLSSSIQEIVSKPQYKIHYGLGLNTSMESKKSSLKNMVDFYKDKSAETVREKMSEQQTQYVPHIPSCQNRPVPVRVDGNTQKNLPVRNREYLRKLSDSSNSSEELDTMNDNGKRLIRSILHDKSRKSRVAKKVSFGNQLQRVNNENYPLLTLQKSSSSIIKYTSSDDEDNSPYIDDETQKKIFTEDKAIVRNGPSLRLSLVKRTRVNPFINKDLIEKTSMTQSILSEKAGKRKANPEFYKANGKKYNQENSFGSDNLLNDSKVETDSEISNGLNGDSPRDFRNQRAKYDSLSDVSDGDHEEYKASSPQNFEVQQESDVTPLDYMEEVEEKKDIKKEKSPIIKAQEAPKIDLLETKKVEAPKLSLFTQSTPSTTGGLFQSLNAPKEAPKTEQKAPLFGGSLFSQKPQETAPKETQEEKPLLKLFSAGPQESDKKEEKPIIKEDQTLKSIQEVPAAMEESVPKVETIKPAPINPFIPVAEVKKEEAPSPVPAPPTAGQSLYTTPVPLKSSYSITEEDKKNPIFAGLDFNKPAPVASNNPFLKQTPQRGLSFTDIIGGGGNSVTSSPSFVDNNVQATNTTNKHAQTANLLKDLVTSSQPETNKPLGILDILSGKGPSQASNILPTTLTQSASVNWLAPANSTAPSNTQNLFGNLSSAAPQTSIFGGQPQQQSQNGLFGSMGGSNNTGMMDGMMGESNNNNSMLGGSGGMFGGNNNFLGGSNNMLGGGMTQNNNSTNGLFGGNIGGMNSGSSMGGFGNSFGGGSMGNENQMGGMGSNPFLSQSSSMGGSSMGGGMAQNNAASSLFGGGNMGGSGLLSGGGNSYTSGSANKRKNQKERAF